LITPEIKPNTIYQQVTKTCPDCMMKVVLAFVLTHNFTGKTFTCHWWLCIHV